MSIVTAPAVRQQINVAPAATHPPATPAASFTSTQWGAIDRAVTQSLAGIQAGNTVGGFASIFESDLLKNPGTNADGSLFTVADATALSNAYINVAGGGAGFRDQGSSATPFATAWDARLKGLFGTKSETVAPTPAAKPVVVAPPPSLIQPTPNPVAPPATTQPSAAVVPPPAALPADPVPGTSVVDAIAALLAGGGKSTVSALQTTTPGTSASTPTGTTSTTPATDPTTAALLSALGGSSAGFTSPDMSAGTPSTGGIQAITPVAAPSTTSSNPALVAIVVAIAVVGAGVVAVKVLGKKKGASPGAGGAPRHVVDVPAPRAIASV